MTSMVRQRKARPGRRAYTDKLKEEAVQMLLDGHRPKAVAANLGLSGSNLLYRWKEEMQNYWNTAGRPPRLWKDACVNWKSNCVRSSASVMFLKKPWPFSARRSKPGLRRHRAVAARFPRVAVVRNPERQSLGLLRLAAGRTRYATARRQPAAAAGS